uniref:DUF1640 domain-containing protein n=1 Tax=Candidatus Kentrum sp. LPFa TaxID=2126335 RepID=A0A450WAH5_9GAMM|nr:MAG: hypothetical protein BECKLPF1236A_GA0070988_100983 [Candidatus Kentron sp. LPFa]VFK29924.1 MAG: hypothetical protein BECKLPF1236C_GA0070990_100984 [Candidatus Kentron sp. LPFa]
MLENDIFEQWLSEEANRVLVKLKNNELLSQDDKLIIVLKGQMNHFHHLDVELRQDMLALRQDMDGRFNALRQGMDRRFEVISGEVNALRQDMDRRFETVTDEIKQLHGEIKQIYRAINTQTWKMIGAIGLIVLLGRLIENF